jgi:hypothetical protein
MRVQVFVVSELRSQIDPVNRLKERERTEQVRAHRSREDSRQRQR